MPHQNMCRKSPQTDGSGINPSVNEENATIIASFVIKSMGDRRCNSILDIGSGLGWFVKGCKDLFVPKVLGCDGNTKLAQKAVAPVLPCNSLDIQDKFDLTTSFEVAEHIHADHQDEFWQHVKFLSPCHFCSIHCRGPEHEFHRFIRDQYYWLNYFYTNMNAKSVEVFQIPQKYQEIPNGTNQFHIETKIPWECSLICLIDW